MCFFDCYYLTCNYLIAILVWRYLFVFGHSNTFDISIQSKGSRQAILWASTAQQCHWKIMSLLSDKITPRLFHSTHKAFPRDTAVTQSSQLAEAKNIIQLPRDLQPCVQALAEGSVLASARGRQQLRVLSTSQLGIPGRLSLLKDVHISFADQI